MKDCTHTNVLTKYIAFTVAEVCSEEKDKNDVEEASCNVRIQPSY